MSLRLALRIDGDAKGAKKALEDTTAGVKKLKEESGATAEKITKVGDASVPAMEKVSAGAGKASSDVIKVGGAAIKSSGDFLKLGDVAKGAMIGIAGGLVGTLVSGVIEKLTGAVADYVSEIVSAQPQIERAVKGHTDIMDRVSKKLRGMKSEAQDYGKELLSVLRLEATQNITNLGSAFKRETREKILPFAKIATRQHEGLNDAEYERYSSAINDLRTGIQNGTSDVVKFRDEIAQIANDLPTDNPFREVAVGILEMTEKAGNLQADMQQAKDLISALDDDAVAAGRSMGTFARKIVESGAAAKGAVPALRELRSLTNSQGLAATGLFDDLLPPATQTQPVPFAKGGIVNAPTGFSFNGGKPGLMGEAGPEAILPLVSGSNGVGVKALTGNGETTVGLKRMASGELGVELPNAFAAGAVFGSQPSTADEVGELKKLTALQREEIANRQQNRTHIRAETASMNRLASTAASVSVQLINGANAGEVFSSTLANIGQQLLQRGLQQLFMALLGGGVGGGNPFMSMLFSANGNAFSGGRMTAFADGGVVGGPTMFPMRSGIGLMGEAGPEAIMPLKRNSAGRLGVEVAGSQSTIRVELGPGLEASMLSRARGQSIQIVRDAAPAISAQGAQGGQQLAKDNFARTNWGKY